MHIAKNYFRIKAFPIQEKNRNPLGHRRINDTINFSDCVQYFLTCFSDLELGNQQKISEKDLQNSVEYHRRVIRQSLNGRIGGAFPRFKLPMNVCVSSLHSVNQLQEVRHFYA